MLYHFFAVLQQDLSPILGADPIGTVTEAAAGVAEATGIADVIPTATQAPEGMFGGGGMWIWAVYAVVLVGMYFLLMRPQRKREKQMKEMQAGLRVGDNVVTSSGLFGKITDVGDDAFVVEFGTNRGIRIPVRKSDVQGVKEPKLTPPPKVEP